MSGKGCALRLWHSLDFSLTCVLMHNDYCFVFMYVCDQFDRIEAAKSSKDVGSRPYLALLDYCFLFLYY